MDSLSGFPQTRTMSTKKWKKVLYEDQNVPDNYVDDTFLDDLKKNCKTIAIPFQFISCISYIIAQRQRIVTMMR